MEDSLLQTGSYKCGILGPQSSRRPVQVVAAGARAVVGVRAADLPVHPWEQPEPRRVLVDGALPLRRTQVVRAPKDVVGEPGHRPVARRGFRGFAAATRRALQEAGFGAGVAVRAGRTRPGRRPSPRPNQLPNQLPSPSPSPRPSRRPIRRPSRLGRRPNPRLLGSRRGPPRPVVLGRVHVRGGSVRGSVDGGRRRGTRGLLPLRALVQNAPEVDAVVRRAHAPHLPVAGEPRQLPQTKVAPRSVRATKTTKVLRRREAQHLEAHVSRQRFAAPHGYDHGAAHRQFASQVLRHFSRAEEHLHKNTNDVQRDEDGPQVLGRLGEVHGLRRHFVRAASFYFIEKSGPVEDRNGVAAEQADLDHGPEGEHH
ncbi:unnamed protein product [Pelagomonas calceolata]|uniref:Uncharacterized protein n=1 Tax=Pelagomonas calceolata TaxID=35677 RepID=A0A8J2SYS4_9STRA|nr:unnamed protein product [Pelagomonas calceolata]